MHDAVSIVGQTNSYLLGDLHDPVIRQPSSGGAEDFGQIKYDVCSVHVLMCFILCDVHAVQGCKLPAELTEALVCKLAFCRCCQGKSFYVPVVRGGCTSCVKRRKLNARSPCHLVRGMWIFVSARINQMPTTRKGIL